eukprot:369194-Amphidinium_carterae.1
MYANGAFKWFNTGRTEQIASFRCQLRYRHEHATKSRMATTMRYCAHRSSLVDQKATCQFSEPVEYKQAIETFAAIQQKLSQQAKQNKLGLVECFQGSPMAASKKPGDYTTITLAAHSGQTHKLVVEVQEPNLVAPGAGHVNTSCNMRTDSDIELT